MSWNPAGTVAPADGEAEGLALPSSLRSGVTDGDPGPGELATTFGCSGPPRARNQPPPAPAAATTTIATTTARGTRRRGRTPDGSTGAGYEPSHEGAPSGPATGYASSGPDPGGVGDARSLRGAGAASGTGAVWGW